MKLKKNTLEVIFNVVRGADSLKLSEARKRDAFLKELEPLVVTFDTDRRKIYETLCIKNEDGIPDISDNTYKFDKAVHEDLGKELQNLYDEEVEVSKTEGLKEILEKTNYSPKVGESEIIDTVLAEMN